MRTFVCLAVVALSTLAAGAAQQGAAVDPERLLSQHLQFTENEIGQARQGQPVVKVKIDGEELGAVGAIRLPGKKERLSHWIKNIEHFRRSAELGVAQPVPTPPTAAAFDAVTLDAKDVNALKQCTPEKCAMRLPEAALARLHADMSQANEVFRQMLLDQMTSYLRNGNSYAVGPLARKAVTLTAISPELVTFLERYPAATLPASDQLLYWGATPAGSVSIISLHHLVVYNPRPNEIWIADKSFYASRYFDTGVLVIGLYDASDGNGFYAVAGSRAKSAYLGKAAASLMRRQVQRSAADTVKTYLEWLRDSLAAS